MSSLNAHEEVELAQLLVSLHPWAERVRFCRTGGEAMAIAVRIARAHCRRDRVAFCGYHGWSDWYLAANLPTGDDEKAADVDRLDGHLLPGLDPTGVPRGLGGTALPFAYNQLDQLAEIVSHHGDQLAAVVIEPVRTIDPEPGFLAGVRKLCDQCGAALIFDEISSGWPVRARRLSFALRRRARHGGLCQGAWQRSSDGRDHRPQGSEWERQSGHSFPALTGPKRLDPLLR